MERGRNMEREKTTVIIRDHRFLLRFLNHEELGRVTDMETAFHKGMIEDRFLVEGRKREKETKLKFLHKTI